jgi:hypothetical protein
MDDREGRSGPGPESETRRRNTARLAREGSWFVLLTGGFVVLIATAFYRNPLLSATSPGCHAQAYGFTCAGAVGSKGPFGAGLGSPLPSNFANVSPWATTYWVASIFVAVCAVVAFYWLRSRAVGTRGRTWPFAAVGSGVLVLGVVSRGWLTTEVPSDLWIRGMQALLVIAVGLIVLAIIERSWPFSLFVAGFLGLALLSCLYNVSNLFPRLGLGGSWIGNDEALPNLILPGLYLVAGGLAFWALHRSAGRREPGLAADLVQ